MAPLEPWEKVLVDTEFVETVHGRIACQDCHQGVQNAQKAIAHQDLVSRPSESNLDLCANCHTEAEAFPESLHASQAGYFYDLAARGADIHSPEIAEMFGNHCASCHTSCGDCHVSQPASVGSGFIDGHIFKGTPSMTRNCTACHGSRVGKEYLGQQEGLLADVHFRQARMTCVDCHSGASMHNSQEACENCHSSESVADWVPLEHRYIGSQNPSCADCHAEALDPASGNLYHLQHSKNLSCQVCHSIQYNNCQGCHVAVSEKTGKAVFSTQGSVFDFLIGMNPIEDEHRAYSYVVVRHVPVDPESFAFYGDNLMPDFNAAPTWVYASPHNIQLQTPQNASCDGCHNNPDWFLTADKVSPEELEANFEVIVESLPNSN